MITTKACPNLGTNGEVKAPSGSAPVASAAVRLKTAYLRQ